MTATILEHETITQPETQQDTGHLSHIVLIPPDRKDDTTAQAYVLEARIMGFEVEALCGHRWVPARNPANHPVCQRCLDIYQTPGSNEGNNESRRELPDA